MALIRPPATLSETKPESNSQALLNAAKTNDTSLALQLLETEIEVGYTTGDGYTALHWAAKNKNFILVKNLLKKGFRLSDKTTPEDKTTSGRTPIELASSLGHWDLVTEIAKENPTDTADSYHYGSALIDATKANRTDVAFALLEAGAKTTWYTIDNGYTALHWAAHTNNLLLAERLAQSSGLGKKSTPKNNIRGYTPIEVASSLGHWDFVTAIAKKYPTDKDDSYHYGSALLDTAADDRLDVALVLIEAGANKTWYSTKTGYYPLHWVAKNNNLLFLNKLLEKGFSLNKKNTPEDKKATCYTPIEVAARLGHWDMIKDIATNNSTDEKDSYHYGSALLDAARKDKTDVALSLIQPRTSKTWYSVKEGYTALHWAAENNNMRLFNALKQIGFGLGTKTTTKDKNATCYTPIEVASQSHRWDLVKAIATEYHTDKEDTFNYGSALIDAIQEEDRDDVSLALIQAGASHTWHSKWNGYYALHWAASRGSLSLATALLKIGADAGEVAHPHDNNCPKITPLELAIESRRWDIVAEMKKYSPDFLKKHAATLMPHYIKQLQAYTQKWLGTYHGKRAMTLLADLTKDLSVEDQLQRLTAAMNPFQIGIDIRRDHALPPYHYTQPPKNYIKDEYNAIIEEYHHLLTQLLPAVKNEAEAEFKSAPAPLPSQMEGPSETSDTAEIKPTNAIKKTSVLNLSIFPRLNPEDRKGSEGIELDSFQRRRPE